MMNYRPAVILATLKHVDFIAAARPIETTRTMLGFKEQIGFRLPIDTLRISITQRPYLRPGILHVLKRVIRRHSSIIIQPQRFPRKRIETLRQVTLGGVAGRDVEFAVWPKTRATARMILGCRQVIENDFAINERRSILAIANHSDSLSFTFVRVGKIEKVVRRELRVQRNAHQAAFSAGLDIRHCEQRFGS